MITLTPFDRKCIAAIEERISPCNDLRWIPALAANTVKYVEAKPPYVVDIKTNVKYTITQTPTSGCIRVFPLNRSISIKEN